ncbi:hypothetical protein C0J52_19179 [Blattella germanica]|nr:hypothetical protein C0J52_19179 [Blattella germanica]
MQLLSWPPRSPDITPCDFQLWGYVKDSLFVPPLPELRDRHGYTLRDELYYRLDVCRVTRGAHIEHL